MSTAHDVLLVLHILSVIVAFAPMATTTPLMRDAGRAEGPGAVQRLAGYFARNDQRIHSPALILAGLFGIAMILVEDFWGFDQMWVSMAFLVWIAMNGVLHGMLRPAERKLSEGVEGARRRMDMGGGIMTLLLLVMLYLMVFTPGT